MLIDDVTGMFRIAKTPIIVHRSSPSLHLHHRKHQINQANLQRNEKNSAVRIVIEIAILLHSKMIQRKRNSQERTTQSQSPLNQRALPLPLADDDNSKQQRKSKRRSLCHCTNVTPRLIFVPVVIFLVLFWVKRGSSGFLLQKQTTNTPDVLLLFPNVMRSSSAGIAIPKSRYRSKIPDWGDIDPYHSWAEQYHEGQRIGFRRRIHKNDEDHYNKERRQFLYEIDEENEDWASGYDEHIEEYRPCQPTNWKKKIFPVCNTFHELQRNWGSDQLLG